MSYVSVLVGYRRLNAEPLEADTLFHSLSDAQNYASSNPTAYPGQSINVLENSEITTYSILPDKSLNRLSVRHATFSPASSPYNINHGLNCYPQVLLIDTNGLVSECQVRYVDNNNIIVEWNGTFSGMIALHG